MQKVFSNSMTVHMWAQQSQPYGRNTSESLSFNGSELISYNTAIALHYGDFVLQSSDNFSPTTGSKHMVHIRRAVTVPVIHIDNIFAWSKRFYSPRDYPTGGEIKKALLASILDLSKSYAKRRMDSTRSWDARRIDERLVELKMICDRFKLAYPKGYSNYQEVLGTTDKVVKRLEAKVKRERAAVERKHKAQRATDQKQFDKWLAGEVVEVPYSFSRQGYYLTVRGDMVHTSGGAQCPLSHARLAFKLYDRVRATGETWKRNGQRCQLGHFQLDMIDFQGNAQAGCHTFLRSELERFAARWL